MELDRWEEEKEQDEESASVQGMICRDTPIQSREQVSEWEWA